MKKPNYKLADTSYENLLFVAEMVDVKKEGTEVELKERLADYGLLLRENGMSTGMKAVDATLYACFYELNK